LPNRTALPVGKAFGTFSFGCVDTQFAQLAQKTAGTFHGVGTRQPLPTARQAAKGVGLAAYNAWTHIECAEALQKVGHFGAASAHLVLAVEEAVKARVYYQWPALVASMTPKELRELLYTHRARHGIAVFDSMSQPLRASIALWHIDHPGRRIDRKVLSRMFARHSDAFPLSWAQRADRDKQRGMHVDWGGRAWITPASVTEAQYQRRFVRCLDFVLKTNAAVGLFDEIRADLAESGWDIDEDRL
jgi:AbiV family abortive infection protein